MHPAKNGNIHVKVFQFESNIHMENEARKNSSVLEKLIIHHGFQIGTEV